MLKSRRIAARLAGWLCVLLLAGVPAVAQQAVPTPGFISDDAVNAVAARMYCPVCEYVPLDTCGEPACNVWKNEIREQLAAGKTADEIISGFVERYGDRVVGVPRDPGLRLLSIVGPVFVAILALFFGVATFSRWQRQQTSALAAPERVPPAAEEPTEDYYARVQRDLEAE